MSKSAEGRTPAVSNTTMKRRHRTAVPNSSGWLNARLHCPILLNGISLGELAMRIFNSWSHVSTAWAWSSIGVKSKSKTFVDRLEPRQNAADFCSSSGQTTDAVLSIWWHSFHSLKSTNTSSCYSCHFVSPIFKVCQHVCKFLCCVVESLRDHDQWASRKSYHFISQLSIRQAIIKQRYMTWNLYSCGLDTFIKNDNVWQISQEGLEPFTDGL